jgi:Zn-dependent protease with chaperone function
LSQQGETLRFQLAKNQSLARIGVILSLGAMLLRFRFGAKPFQSSELDALAERMNVQTKMSSNSGDRWFIGLGTIAYSTKTRVIFGMRLYERLDGSQRSCVAAHELVHIREGDHGFAERRVTIQSALGAVGIFFISLAIWRVPLASAFLALLGWLVLLILSILLISGWRRNAELRCDTLAALYTDGSQLIAALRIQEALVNTSHRRGLIHWIMNKMFPYPTLAERIEAISKLMEVGDAQSLGRS